MTDQPLRALRPDTDDNRSLPCTQCPVTTPDSGFCDLCGTPCCDNCMPGHPCVEPLDDVYWEYIRKACPMQLEGHVSGVPFHFRYGRGRLRIGFGGNNPKVNSAWTYRRKLGEPYTECMLDDDVKLWLSAAVVEWMRRQPDDIDPAERFADEIAAHAGRWVAVKDRKVVYSADAPEDVVSHLREHGMTADSLFRIPVNPEEDH